MSKRRFPLTKFPELLKNPPPNLDIMLYDKIKKGPYPGDNTVKTSRLDRIEASIANLAKEMRDGFKQVNTRLDNVEARLDNVEKRLDYNGLQIERIEKRLDYNNLKQLPINNK